MRAQLAALTVLLSAAPVCAQSTAPVRPQSTAPARPKPVESNSSFSAIGGTGKTYDDEGSLGKGMLIGAAYDHVLVGTTRLEGSIELATHDRESGVFQSTGRTVTGGLSLVQRFGRGQAQPYVFGGVTVAHHTGTNVSPADTLAVSSTNAGTRFGFGIAFHDCTGRLEISPELRMNGFSSNKGSDPWMLPSFGLRVGWRL